MGVHLASRSFALTLFPPNCVAEVYAVVDLYGQCVQVSITSATGPMDNSLSTSNITEKSFPIHSPGESSSPANSKFDNRFLCLPCPSSLLGWPHWDG